MKLDLHSVFTTHYAKGIILSLIALMLMLLLLSWGSFFFSANPMSQQRPVIASQDASKKNDLSHAILTASLFGVYVPNDLNKVKKSMLNVTLVGILLANKVEDSQVIIKASGGEEKTYTAGDTLPGGVIIKKITATGVLVERNGTLESLSLPKNDLTFEPVAKPLKEE